MKFSVKDRLLISNLFPQKASLTDQILVKDITAKIAITQKEMTAYGLKSSPDGQIRWDADKEKAKNVDFTEAELELLKRQVEEKDKSNEITQEVVDLCIKIKNAEAKK